MGVLLGLALLLPGQSQADAPAKAWDAGALAQIIQRFTIQTKHIQESVGRHVESAAKDSPRRIVLDDVYDIHHRAISLESAVRSGQGRDQAEPVFRRLLASVQNARRDAASFPEIQEASGAIGKARELLAEMYGYFYAGPMPEN